MQETILLLRQQLNSLLGNSQPQITESDMHKTCSKELLRKQGGNTEIWPCGENPIDENTPKSVISLNRIFSQEDSREFNGNSPLNSQVLKQVDFLLLKMLLTLLHMLIS